MLIDDYLPAATPHKPIYCYNNNAAAGKRHGHEGMWGPLMEKVFAKHATSWAALEGGRTQGSSASVIVRLMGVGRLLLLPHNICHNLHR